MGEVLTEPPGEEGDDSINKPADAPETREDDLEDVTPHDDDDDDDEPDS